MHFDIVISVHKDKEKITPYCLVFSSCLRKLPHRDRREIIEFCLVAPSGVSYKKFLKMVTNILKTPLVNIDVLETTFTDVPLKAVLKNVNFVEKHAITSFFSKSTGSEIHY